jgi:hypothetical protein
MHSSTHQPPSSPEVKELGYTIIAFLAVAAFAVIVITGCIVWAVNHFFFT